MECARIDMDASQALSSEQKLGPTDISWILGVGSCVCALSCSTTKLKPRNRAAWAFAGAWLALGVSLVASYSGCTQAAGSKSVVAWKS